MIEIIEDWTTIRCPWCHEIIDFVKYHESGKLEIIIHGLTPDKILQWEIDLSFESESLESLYGKFIAVRSKLLKQELQFFVPAPRARAAPEDCLQIIVHYHDCWDGLTLEIMNILNDKLVEQRNTRAG